MHTPLRWRLANPDDVTLLAHLNHALTEDEGHAHRARPLAWFVERMGASLQGDYEAVLFEQGGAVVAWALFCQARERQDAIYLRQLYVVREQRRQGLGREALRLLRTEVWPPGKPVVLEVMAQNAVARAFYAALGFAESCIGLELSG